MREGALAAKSGSRRAGPVTYSAGIGADAWEPALITVTVVIWSSFDNSRYDRGDVFRRRVIPFPRNNST
jgi:hypothetical protein